MALLRTTMDLTEASEAVDSQPCFGFVWVSIPQLDRGLSTEDGGFDLVRRLWLSPSVDSGEPDRRLP